MSYVIGIDPGMRTGLVILSNVDYQTATYELAANYTIEWEDRYRLRDILASCVPYLGYIVMENFRLYENRAKDQINNEFPSVKIIERVTVYCEQLECVEKIRLQMASTIYRAKGIKWPIPREHWLLLDHKYDHEQDAYHHARYFIQMYKHRKVMQ